MGVLDKISDLCYLPHPHKKRRKDLKINPSSANLRPNPISTNKFHKSEVLNLKSWLRSTIPLKPNRRGQKTLNPLSDYHRRPHQTQKQSSPFRWIFSIATFSYPIGIDITKPNRGYRPYRWLLRRLLIPEHRKNGRRKRKRVKKSERCRRQVSIRKHMGVAVRWGKAMDRRSKPGVEGSGFLPQSRQMGVKKRGSDSLGAKFSIFRWGCDHQPLSWKADPKDWRLVLCFQFEVGLGRYCKIFLVSLAYLNSKEGGSEILTLHPTLRLPCADKKVCLFANVWDFEFALVWSRNWFQFLIWRLIKTMEKKLNEKVSDKKCWLLVNAACSCKWCCYFVGSLNRFVGWISSHIFSLLVYYIEFLNLECIWYYVCNFADLLFGFRNLCFNFISISEKSNEEFSVTKAWSSEVLVSKSKPYSSLGPHIRPKSHCSKHSDDINFDENQSDGRGVRVLLLYFMNSAVKTMMHDIEKGICVSVVTNSKGKSPLLTISVKGPKTQYSQHKANTSLEENFWFSNSVKELDKSRFWGGCLL